MLLKRLAPLLVLFVAAYAAGPLSVDSQWSRVQLPGGIQGCKNDATGEVFNTGYVSKQYGAAVCSQAWKFLTWWWINSAEAANFRKSPVPGPDGVVDTSCDGAACDPAPATLACDDTAYAYPSLSGLVTNTNAINENVRARFSGTGAAGATLSIVTVSGDTPSVNGWSISGDNLVNAGTDADLPGSGAFLIRGTTGGSDVDCSTRNWSYVDPPSTDTVAPNFVSGITSPSQGAGTVTLEFDATVDPDDNTARTGVSAYNIYRNGTMIDSLTAASPGLVNDFTCANVGSPTGSLSGVQSGAQWTVTGGGAGLEGAADSVYACGMAVSGAEVTIITRVSSLPNSGPYNKAFIELSASNAVDTVAANCTLQRVGADYYLNSRNRTVTAGARASSFTLAIGTTIPAYLRGHLDASGWDCDYSLDGGTWIVGQSNLAVSLPDSKIARFGSTATSNGVTIAAVFDYVSVSTQYRLTKTVSPVAGSATFTARPVDVQANEQTALVGVTATPGAPPATGNMKTQPGYYAFYNTMMHPGGTVGSARDITNILANIQSEICPNQYIVGFGIRGIYKWFEGATLGSYSGGAGAQGGFYAIDAILNALANCSTGRKYLILSVTNTWYQGGTTAAQWNAGGVSWAGEFPAYMMPTNHGGTDSGNVYGGGAQPNTQVSQGGNTLKTWDNAVKNRIIALAQAYCARYEDDPSFYSFGAFWDTSVPMAYGDYPEATLNANVREIMAATRVACPTTNINFSLSYQNPHPQQASDHLEHCATIDCTIQPSDTSVGEQWGQSAFVGEIGDPAHDWRGELRYVAEVEPPDMCGSVGFKTPTQLFDRMQNGSAGNAPWWPTHIAVYQATECAAPYNWAAWKTFINANQGKVMNGRDSTLRTPAEVKASWCEDLFACD